MIPWIQVYSNLITHPKTSRLADRLKLRSSDTTPDVVAAGMLVSLWTWAVQNAYDGDLSGLSDRAIADAARYRKKPGAFVAALKETGWLDPDGRLHDWVEHAHLLIEAEDKRKEKNRERVRKHRENKKCNAPCNVTETPCNASTIPDHTIPNQYISGGDGDRACVRAQEDQLAGIGLEPGEYPLVTVEQVEQATQVAGELFAMIPGRICGPLDRRKVFEHLGGSDPSLLRYAFAVASQVGKAGNWNYIDGIMARLHARGIRDAQQAKAWDEERPDKEDFYGTV